MAAGGPTPELDLHLLECPICLERLRQPKSLPCLHCFCQDCLGTYITKELSGNMASATSFPCPICRRMTPPVNPADPKDRWAEQYQSNGVIQDLIELTERSSEPMYCKPCQAKSDMNNPAKFWCKTMDVNFCETCKVHHHDIIHTDCGIVDITGYDVIRPNQEKPASRCGQHDKKKIWYCEDHQFLGCNICVFKDHRRCEEVNTVTGYFHKLKEGSQLADMQAALKTGADAMDLFVKDFDEQLQVMMTNQEIAMQSITDLRQKVDKQLNKLQKDVTDELIMSFKEKKGIMESLLRQCERLMNSMLNTMKSSVTSVEGNDNIETIVLYQRGQAEVESCKSLITEMSKSFTSVSINHVVSGLGTLGDDAMGKIVLEKQPRRVPGIHSDLAPPLSERRVKEIGKFNIKTPSDDAICRPFGVLYLPDNEIVVSDYSNKKLKLFTDKGQYLDELIIDGNPWDLCMVNNNTVAVAVGDPGGVRVVKVEASKLSLSSEINMPRNKNCHGITHRDGKFVVGTHERDVYSVTQGGVTDLLHKYQTHCCFSLTHDPIKGDTLVSVHANNKGDLMVSRLSANRRHARVMKAGVVKGAWGIDVDRESNIYVCGKHTHNVVQISEDRTRVRELLARSHGLAYPLAISVRGDRFVVTDDTVKDKDNVRVFQLY